TGLLDTGVPYSIFYIDSFDLTYYRYFQAKDNRLAFNGLEPGEVMTVYGFTESDIIVADITEPDRPVRIAGAFVEESEDGYKVSFKAAVQDARYLAVAKSALMTPGIFTTAVSSDLKHRWNRVDYMVITPASLRTAADSLADHRRSMGFDTKVVELEAVVDTFNHGVFSPKAVKDFLAYVCSSWRKPPGYVVLVGNGTYDYKNYLGHDDNLMPPLLVKTPDGIFASDNRLADIDDDGVPEISIGRLPVVTVEELENVIEKIRDYEGYGYGSWTQTVMLLADDPDMGGNFPADSDDVGSLIPHNFDTRKIYLYEHSLEDVRQLVLDGLNEGALLMNYIGHGAPDRFSQEGILLTNDVPLLVNDNRLPVVTAMTCVVGRFAIPGYDSLSETLLLHKEGGAIAVWAPTGLSLNAYA
ncbi:MAG: hypothetical protein GY850_30060, partial [bacterium]|nr:hypothetical protein [bacterium]